MGAPLSCAGQSSKEGRPALLATTSAAPSSAPPSREHYISTLEIIACSRYAPLLDTRYAPFLDTRYAPVRQSWQKCGREISVVIVGQRQTSLFSGAPSSVSLTARSPHDLVEHLTQWPKVALRILGCGCLFRALLAVEDRDGLGPPPQCVERLGLVDSSTPIPGLVGRKRAKNWCTTRPGWRQFRVRACGKPTGASMGLRQDPVCGR